MWKKPGKGIAVRVQPVRFARREVREHHMYAWNKGSPILKLQNYIQHEVPYENKL